MVDKSRQALAVFQRGYRESVSSLRVRSSSWRAYRAVRINLCRRQAEATIRRVGLPLMRVGESKLKQKASRVQAINGKKDVVILSKIRPSHCVT